MLGTALVEPNETENGLPLGLVLLALKLNGFDSVFVLKVNPPGFAEELSAKEGCVAGFGAPNIKSGALEVGFTPKVGVGELKLKPFDLFVESVLQLMMQLVGYQVCLSKHTF